MTTLLVSFRMLAVLTLLTGVVYPLVVWTIGQAAFPHRAEGSLVARDGRIVGSELIAQKTNSQKYFWPRPSAGEFSTMPSGASNLAWTSAKLATVIVERRAEAGIEDVPQVLLTSSGSGLDPHLTPEGIRAQVERVAEARGFDGAKRVQLDALIHSLTEGGGLSPSRVNLLRLNLEMDDMTP